MMSECGVEFTRYGNQTIFRIQGWMGIRAVIVTCCFSVAAAAGYGCVLILGSTYSRDTAFGEPSTIYVMLCAGALVASRFVSARAEAESVGTEVLRISGGIVEVGRRRYAVSDIFDFGILAPTDAAGFDWNSIELNCKAHTKCPWTLTNYCVVCIYGQRQVKLVRRLTEGQAHTIVAEMVRLQGDLVSKSSNQMPPATV